MQPTPISLPWLERHNVPFFPLQFDSHAFVQDPKAQSWLDSNSPLKLAVNSYRVVRPTPESMLRDCWQACQGTDAIIYHNFTLPNAYLIGRELGLPCLPASMYPVPTQAHPALAITLPNRFGPLFNRLSHRIVDQFTWLGYRSAARSAWPEIGPISRRPPYYQPARPQPIVCCYSPVVLPVPADLPDYVYVTGYWPRSRNRAGSPTRRWSNSWNPVRHPSMSASAAWAIRAKQNRLRRLCCGRCIHPVNAACWQAVGAA